MDAGLGLAHRKTFWMAVAAACVIGLAAAIVAGVAMDLREQKRKEALRQALLTMPEPERCVLCGSGMTYHAPVIVELATGRMLEMQVYDSHPAFPGEIVETGQTDIIKTFYSGGMLAVNDPGAKTCRTSLPAGGDPIDPALYCLSCREILSGAGLEGYVIADLYNPTAIAAYPMTAGADYGIRTYSVSITRGGKGEGNWDVLVRGLQ